MFIIFLFSGKSDAKAALAFSHRHVALLLRQPGGPGGVNETVQRQGANEEPVIILDRAVIDENGIYMGEYICEGTFLLLDICSLPGSSCNQK